VIRNVRKRAVSQKAAVKSGTNPSSINRANLQSRKDIRVAKRAAKKAIRKGDLKGKAKREALRAVRKDARATKREVKPNIFQRAKINRTVRKDTKSKVEELAAKNGLSKKEERKLKRDLLKANRDIKKAKKDGDVQKVETIKKAVQGRIKEVINTPNTLKPKPILPIDVSPITPTFPNDDFADDGGGGYDGSGINPALRPPIMTMPQVPIIQQQPQYDDFPPVLNDGFENPLPFESYPQQQPKQYNPYTPQQPLFSEYEEMTPNTPAGDEYPIDDDQYQLDEFGEPMLDEFGEPILFPDEPFAPNEAGMSFLPIALLALVVGGAFLSGNSGDQPKKSSTAKAKRKVGPRTKSTAKPARRATQRSRKTPVKKAIGFVELS
jgi:hypothetical protein